MKDTNLQPTPSERFFELTDKAASEIEKKINEFVKEMVEIEFVEDVAHTQVSYAFGGVSVKTYIDLFYSNFPDDDTTFAMYSIDSGLFHAYLSPHNNFDVNFHKEGGGEIQGRYLGSLEECYISTQVRNDEEMVAVVEDWKQVAFSEIEKYRKTVKQLSSKIER